MSPLAAALRLRGRRVRAGVLLASGFAAGAWATGLRRSGLDAGRIGKALAASVGAFAVAMRVYFAVLVLLRAPLLGTALSFGFGGFAFFGFEGARPGSLPSLYVGSRPRAMFGGKTLYR